MNDADEGDTKPSECLTLADRPFHPTSEARRSVSVEWARHTGHAAHLYLLRYRRAAELLLPELITRSNEQLLRRQKVWHERLTQLAVYMRFKSECLSGDSDSELETAAREAIAEDFEWIAKAYGFDADIEELIAPRDW